MTATIPIWEVAGDPDPAGRLHARRRRWSIAALVSVVVAIPAVIAFGPFGLVYPAVVAVVAGAVIESANIAGRLRRTTRVTNDGRALVFDGAETRDGRIEQPIALAEIDRFCVYPGLGGFQNGSDSRMSLTVVVFWLVGGRCRTVSFPVVSSDASVRWSGIDDQLRLVAALDELLPGRRRSVPAELPDGAPTLHRRRLERWGDTNRP